MSSASVETEPPENGVTISTSYPSTIAPSGSVPSSML